MINTGLLFSQIPKPSYHKRDELQLPPFHEPGTAGRYSTGPVQLSSENTRTQSSPTQKDKLRPDRHTSEHLHKLRDRHNLRATLVEYRALIMGEGNLCFILSELSS